MWRHSHFGPAFERSPDFTSVRLPVERMPSTRVPGGYDEGYEHDHSEQGDADQSIGQEGDEPRVIRGLVHG